MKSDEIKFQEVLPKCPIMTHRLQSAGVMLLMCDGSRLPSVSS